ncbi:hypothetical protein BH10ACT8_BH10ACT8_18060 [soil metagenome]
MFSPAERVVTVDILDPAGHRLIRFGQDLDLSTGQEIWVDEASVPDKVGVQHHYDDAGEWTYSEFRCPACRDAGALFSSVAAPLVRAAAAALLEKHRPLDTPGKIKLQSIAALQR